MHVSFLKTYKTGLQSSCEFEDYTEKAGVMSAGFFSGADFIHFIFLKIII